MAAKNLTLLHQAVRWATKLHRGQDRDGAFPMPYISHPLEVANILRYKADVMDDSVLAIAVLHDVVEECGVTCAEVSKRFGAVIASGVAELTRREPSATEIEGLDVDQIWQIRSDLLIEDIAKMSNMAKKIKLADRLSNLSEAIATRPPDKVKRYVQQTYLILEAIPREVCPVLWDAIRELADSA